MGTASRAQRADALRKAGWPETLITTMTAVSLSEFGASRDLVTQSQSDYINAQGQREQSYGPFQINIAAHPDVSQSCASDLNCSAAAALRIFRGNGNSFRPWSAYTNGSYLSNLVGNGVLDGTVPTVSAQSPDAQSRNAITNAATHAFPSIQFPQYTLIPATPLFGGIKVDTSVIFKLGLTVGIFAVLFLGILKLTGAGAPSIPKVAAPSVPKPTSPEPSATPVPAPAGYLTVPEHMRRKPGRVKPTATTEQVSQSWTPAALKADRERRIQARKGQ